MSNTNTSSDDLIGASFMAASAYLCTMPNTDSS
eukprot:CAMPEP_0172307968 /NCGR_PEP_ID=MMETSP1058-20130122/8711_1 /TAXON_ID=83371 /ORGANISM="Detonula confervacea, Strain CCMP 353" /LENGTH=32 /DNA_ID= /DNA_START= /DNA_END= /DNA_ORIENTATION=